MILDDCISVIISLEEPVSILEVVLVDIPDGGLEVVFGCALLQLAT